MNYLDTSALVKRFVEEEGSALVKELVEREGPAATSKIAYAEVYSAFYRRSRAGDLSKARCILAARQFETDWQAYLRIDLSEEILLLARDLIQRHPLRGFDALHVASAINLNSALGESVAFATADEQQLRAAAAEGLEILNVESRRPR